ncbi:MAG TPA: tRNA (adenine-N1)-methyltransferase [Methanomicrobia archaeon]|nr:tRNA (adenine-N1)-methyltransferase [Methanomicrobia archaeon]
MSRQRLKRLKDGELVHLLDEKGKGRRHEILLKAGSSFTFSRGTISHDEIIGLAEGSTVKSSLGRRLVVVRPTLAEYVAKMRKGSQVIYPKDIAAILMLADIFPGASVLEAGTGSGALTLALLRAVGTAGRVVSYERRREFLEVARKNIETFFGRVAASAEKEGLGSGSLELREKDIYEGVEEEEGQGEKREKEEFDRIILDLSEPWRVLPHAEESLRDGGILLCYNPTVLQIFKLAKRLELRHAKSFRVTGIYEVGLREWEVKGRSIRPELRMVAHTGFIFVARKCSPTESKLP